QLAGQQAPQPEVVALHPAVVLDGPGRLPVDLEDAPQRRDGQVERLLVDGGVRLRGAAGRLAQGGLLGGPDGPALLALEVGEGPLVEAVRAVEKGAGGGARPPRGGGGAPRGGGGDVRGRRAGVREGEGGEPHAKEAGADPGGGPADADEPGQGQVLG